MYLADDELKELLPSLNIERDISTPFDKDQHIQPCSIDLCLSSVFWKERRRGLIRRGPIIDLSRSRLNELAPLHNWRRIDLCEDAKITLKPGEILLARTSEKFSMPSGYAGSLKGRSSFARLGLLVHATGSFINPGWRGHMPLQLINASKSSIKLIVGLPICQLCIVKLQGTPSRIYGEAELQSKYMDDNGGPSLWWRDQRIKELQNRLQKTNINERMREEIVDSMETQELDIVHRFETDIDKMRVGDFENSDKLVRAFSEREDRRRKWAQLWRKVVIGSFPILILGIIVEAAFSSTMLLCQWLFWLVVLASMVGALWAWWNPVGNYFGQEELQRAQTRTRPAKRRGDEAARQR